MGFMKRKTKANKQDLNNITNILQLGGDISDAGEVFKTTPLDTLENAQYLDDLNSGTYEVGTKFLSKGGVWHRKKRAAE